MKLKFIQLILLFTFLFNSSFGQYIPLVEEGKFWIYVNYSNPDSPSAISGHAITFIGDTIINSINYKKVYRLKLKGENPCWSYGHYCWNFDIPYTTESKVNTSFIREDTTNRKIYNLTHTGNNSCGTGEYVLFDYSLNIGDTVNCSVYESIWADNTDFSPGGIVDSIKIVEAYDKFRNTIFTYGFYKIVGLPFESEILISEGLGYKDFGIFYNVQSKFVDYCEGEIDQCNLILSKESIHKKNEINIFPNPSKGIFQISINQENFKNIRVFSILGELKTELEINNILDLSNFENGIYLLEFITKDEKRIVKKIIKEN